MSLNTIPEFIYGHRVLAGVNDKIPFDEGSGELNATITPDDYSMEELALAITTALNATGANTYVVSVDRATRIFTIEADANFDLLAATGSTVGTGVFATIGFQATDRTGADTYDGQDASGTVYRPQFVPQLLGQSRFNRSPVDESLQEAADGTQKLIKFGNRRFVEMEIKEITDEPQVGCSQIEENLNGVQNAIDFMEYITEKTRIEYVTDPSTPSVFEKLLLERTPQSRNGTSHSLAREYGRGSPNYFTTGRLVFRKVD